MEPAVVWIAANLCRLRFRIATRCVGDDVRRALDCADHGTHAPGRRIAQGSADGVRELAGLAAELPIAPARLRRELRDAQGDEELAVGEHGGEKPRDEAIERRLAPSGLALDDG